MSDLDDAVLLLIQGFFDERLTLIEQEIDPCTPAGFAVAQLRDTLPDVLSVMRRSLEMNSAVMDVVAVAQEHSL